MIIVMSISYVSKQDFDKKRNWRISRIAPGANIFIAGLFIHMKQDFNMLLLRKTQQVAISSAKENLVES